MGFRTALLCRMSTKLADVLAFGDILKFFAKYLSKTC